MNYYVEGAGWFVVSAKNKRRAKSVGVNEFGRNNVRCVRKATPKEVAEFTAIKGINALKE